MLLSAFFFGNMRENSFCMLRPVWPDESVVPPSSPQVRQTPLRWAQVIKGEHICILALL